MRASHPIIQAFLDYLKYEKRFSQHTLVSYQTDLISFFDYLEITYGAVSLHELSHVYIRSWLASLKDEGLTAKSLNRKISSLRSFFKYQVKTGVIEQTPMSKIIAPKNEKGLPNYVAHTIVKTFLMHVESTHYLKGRI